MPLRELENKLDAIQIELETEIACNDAKILALQQTNSKLHKGMHRKISALSKVVQKAAEANAKVTQ